MLTKRYTRPFALFISVFIGLNAPLVFAQGALAPIPGQTEQVTPQATIPSVEQSGQILSLAPLPGQSALESTMPQGLVEERNLLYEKFEELSTRLENAQAADEPVSFETSSELEQAMVRQAKIRRRVALDQWKHNSADILLQVINGRPMGAVDKLPAGTLIAPRFVQMRLTSVAYVRPSTESTKLAYNVGQGTPILELATLPNGIWSLAWIPGGGYGYMLKDHIIFLGDKQ